MLETWTRFPPRRVRLNSAVSSFAVASPSFSRIASISAAAIVDRWPPSFGNRSHIASFAIPPDPPLHRRFAQRKQRGDHRVSTLAALVRLHNALSEFDRMRFAHGSPDQISIPDASEIDSTEHRG